MRIVYYRTIALGWVTSCYMDEGDFPWFDKLPTLRSGSEWLVPGTFES